MHHPICPQAQGSASPWRRVLWACIVGFGPFAIVILLLALLLVRGERWTRHALGMPYGDELLINAIADNDIPAIKHALAEGASPDSSTDSGTALMWAASNQNELAVNLLLKAGAHVNDMHNSERTALVDAVITGNLQMVKLLLDNGANPNQYSGRIGTPLHNAVIGDNLEIVQLLLAHGADPNLPLANGMTTLDATYGDYHICPAIQDCLIAAGAKRSINVA